MRRRLSSSVRIFYPRLSSEEIIGLLRERLPKVREELPFLEAVEEFLKAAGHEVISVRELDPRMKDVDILDLATREGCLMITMDKD